MFVKFKKVYNNKNGFTLIETIIYVGIIGAVVTSFMGFSVSITNSRNKTYVVQEVQSNARFVLDIVSQKIRRADDVISPIEGNSSNILILDMPGAEPNITLESSNGVLTLMQGVGSPVSLTSDEINISNLSFSNYTIAGERESVEISMKLEYRNNSSDKRFDYSQNLKSNISLRP